MTVKVKRFRIGVEGATTDGREIQREWLEQMAATGTGGNHQKYAVLA